MLLFLHGALGFHLRLANLAFLVLDRDLRVQLVLFDGAFLLDGRIAPGINGFVGLAEQSLPRFSLECPGGFWRRLDGQNRKPQDFKPQRRHFFRRSQSRFHGLDQGVRSANGFAQRKFLQFRPRQDVNDMDDALGQFLRIFRAIVFAITCQGVIQERGEPLGIAHPVGHLALDGDGLKIAGGFLENERCIGAAHRHRHERGRRRVVEKREPGSFAHDLAAAIFQQISGGLNFDEFDAEHIVPFS